MSFLTVLLFGLSGLLSLSWYTAFSSSRGKTRTPALLGGGRCRGSGGHCSLRRLWRITCVPEGEMKQKEQQEEQQEKQQEKQQEEVLFCDSCMKLSVGGRLG